MKISLKALLATAKKILEMHFKFIDYKKKFNNKRLYAFAHAENVIGDKRILSEILRYFYKKRRIEVIDSKTTETKSYSFVTPIGKIKSHTPEKALVRIGDYVANVYTEPRTFDEFYHNYSVAEKINKYRDTLEEFSIL